MAEKTIELPSGLTGTMRGLKLSEFKHLANRKGVKNGTVLEMLLEACWTPSSEAVVAYPQGMSWKTTVLQGDKFVALMTLRALSIGPNFDFDIQCPGCKETISWRVNLDDLPRQNYPLESLKLHAVGKMHSWNLCGRKVEFELLTSAHEKLLRNVIKPEMPDEEKLVRGIAFRTRVVEGLSHDEHQPWLESLDIADVLAYMAEIDRCSGGVDTTIPISCETCGLLEVEIPFGARGYWTPKRKLATSNPSSPRSMPNTSTDTSDA